MAMTPAWRARTAEERGRLTDAPDALRTGRWLALAAFFVYVATGGGRIVGSDELTMLEVSRAMLRGQVAVPEGATMRGPDGRFYSKNAAGQAVLALPLVAVATAAARAAPLDSARRELAVRFVVSFFNAGMTAILLGVFYAGARYLGAPRGPTLAATLMLGFATPLWVYSKSFMAEPLQALGLLMAALGTAYALGTRVPRAEWLAAAGVVIAVSVKLSMLPLALACLVPYVVGMRRQWAVMALGLALALIGHALYDVARFGTPLETGYGAQATGAAYTTPLWVGLYGLLLSPGKGVLWYAPPLWFVPVGFRRMLERARSVIPDAPRLHHASERAAWSMVCAWAAGLLLYARFQHWAGDGSFGPRYLIPLLPLAFLAVAFALGAARGARRWVAGALAILGVLVQIGGVSVYFGAQMREAGDYPYRLSLDDPRFMSDSRWNPRFTPIAGHWRMLIRNVREHLNGHAPRVLGGASGESTTARNPGETGASSAAGSEAATRYDGTPSSEVASSANARVGVGPAEQERLLHALDYWWLYLQYAGLPRAPVWIALVIVVVLAVATSLRAWDAWRTEGGVW
jgi:hypothetical protein